MKSGFDIIINRINNIVIRFYPGSQGAPPPYSANQQGPPQQAAYGQPPPQQVVYAQPPPQTVIYQQAPQRSSSGTNKALLGEFKLLQNIVNYEQGEKTFRNSPLIVLVFLSSTSTSHEPFLLYSIC